MDFFIIPVDGAIGKGKEGHSARKLFTGLALAARRAMKLTVASATKSAPVPARRNTHQLTVVRYTKSCHSVRNDFTGLATAAFLA